MAGSVNKVILVGNLGKDPDVRHSQSGQKIVSFSLATSDTWNDRQSGERRERTEWHKIVVFNERLADVAERFLRKGRKVYLEGQLQTRKWTGQDGKDNYTTEVVLPRYNGELTILDTRHAEEGGQSSGYSSAPQNSGTPANTTPARQGGGWDAPRSNADLDDEIPF
ncbi:single-stranded DNA-binding protein [Acetobacter pasteurianus]|uniref:single-stranded DNA-binding protein n=1 Tax=Acetobacter pasteurianus TaxID=438 RepID=UPI003D0E5E76